MPADIKHLLMMNKVMDGQNSNWRSYDQEVADFCLPRKAWQTSIRQQGDQLKFGHLYDTVAIRALKTMAAGFHSNLTNPSSEWFGLQAHDLKLRKNRECQLWFKDVKDIMYPIIGRSNFYKVAKEFYMEAGAFGTGVIFSEPDPKRYVRFKNIPIGECNLEQDANGNVCGIYWNFRLTAMQAFLAWGKDAGKTVNELKDGPKAHDLMDFLYYCGPRNRREYGKIDKLNMPWQSVWIAKKDEKIMEEGGFEEFPFHVGAWWKEANDPRGYSPAHDVFAGIKLRNAMKKTALRRAMKETDPPLDVPARGYISPLNLNPAAVNYRDPKLDKDNRVTAFGYGAGDFTITKEMLQDEREAIEEGFFVPLFKALSQVTKQMTVPEVQERIREGMILLGPAVGNFTDDVFGPLIDRTFNILYRQGLIPPAPDAMQGQDFGPVFLSPLVRAQRESEMQAIRSFLQDVASIATAKPGALDLVNEDEAVNIVAEIRNINPRMLNSEAKIIEIRKARAEAEQAMQSLDVAHKAAAIAETDAKAGKAAKEAA